MTLLAWWDFGDPNSLYTDAGVTKVSADGQRIYRCADKSGNGNHMDESGVGAGPLYQVGVLNGLSAGFFSNVGGLQSNHAPWGNPFTQFLLARRTAMNGQYQRVFSHTNSANVGQIYADFSSPQTQWGFYSGGPTTTYEIPGTLCDTWGILTIMYNESLQGARWNSVDKSASWDPADGATSSTFARMGANGSGSESFVGHVAENQIHSGALSVSAMQDIERGLGAKWLGLITGLPAGSAAATPSILARGTFGEYGVNRRKVTFDDDGKLRAITEQGGYVGKRRSR